MSDLLNLFPPHKCELSLTHNEHKSSYQTIEEYFENCLNCSEDWISKEQREKAIAQDSVWKLQWYPDTPIGSYNLLACDLDVLLAAAKEVNNGKS